METVRFDVSLIRESEKALLVSIGGEEVWIPKSQIEDTDVKEPGDEGFIEIPEWLAQEKELDDTDGDDWINE